MVPGPSLTNFILVTALTFGCGARTKEPLVQEPLVQEPLVQKPVQAESMRAQARARRVEEQAKALKAKADAEFAAQEALRQKEEQERLTREKEKPIQFFVTLTYGKDTLKLPSYAIRAMRPFHGIRCHENSGSSKRSSSGYHESTRTISCGDVGFTTTCHFGGDPERRSNHSTKFLEHEPSPIKVKFSCEVRNR